MKLFGLELLSEHMPDAIMSRPRPLDLGDPNRFGRLVDATISSRMTDGLPFGLTAAVWWASLASWLRSEGVCFGSLPALAGLRRSRASRLASYSGS